ncbi:MAG: hypothetical protein AAF492_10375, partial [Verrucomicrobiota bacterium]
MNSVKLSAEEVGQRLSRLLDLYLLGNADQRRAENLRSFFDQREKAAVSDVYLILFPESEHGKHNALFRAFKSRLRKALTEAEISLELLADPPSVDRPLCWFEGKESVKEQLQRDVRNLTPYSRDYDPGRYEPAKVTRPEVVAALKKVRLSTAQIAVSLNELLKIGDLGKADTRRVESLKLLFESDDTVDLMNVYAGLFPDSGEEKRYDLFRNFQSRLRKAIARAKLAVQLSANPPTQKAPTCWFEKIDVSGTSSLKDEPDIAGNAAQSDERLKQLARLERFSIDH